MYLDKVMWLQCPSSIEEIVDRNESFDSCIIKICYTGKNRNRSYISKEAIEDAIPTIYNCPIVCNYDVYEDTIGGHDVDIVKTPNGMRLINLTDAIGVIPFNCKYYWETVNDNGEDHEYLCVEAIIWKRSSAYSKIKRDGIVSQSMEITVKNGKSVDGIYQIDKFIFTAFCLLGEDVEPCFESASLETFSLQQYKNQFNKMMADYSKHYSMVNTLKEVDIDPQSITQNLSKGGNISLERIELLAEFGLTADELDFNIEDFSIDELREKFEAIKRNLDIDDDDSDNTGGNDGEEPDEVPDENTENENEPDSHSNDSDESEENDEEGEVFSLTGEQFVSGLIESLSAIKYVDSYWGEICRYGYVDYSPDTSEVYCYDYEDWKLYGFTYSMNGDNVVIDFESKKRKKFSIVDFDEGSVDQSYRLAFDSICNAILASKDLELSNLRSESENKYGAATQTISELQSEIDSLREFKQSKIDEERKGAVEELFAKFEELDGIEAFETLRANCDDMSLDDIENKCFEIKGRNTTSHNFSANKQRNTRIPVEKNKFENEPYGGLFVQYPPTKN